MKEIIVDIGDVSLHKEVYDTRPHRFFAIFIYGLFIMVGVALAWAYFGTIDTVVRAHGIIRPYAQTGVIINAVAGEVTYVNFSPGMVVSQGDVLYIIDTVAQENQTRILEEQLAHLKFRLETLELYEASLEQGINLIGDFNPEYSLRFDSFMMNIASMEHMTVAQSNILNAEQADLQTRLVQAQTELAVLRLFDQSIATGENLFVGSGQEIFNTYRNQFIAYQLDMDSQNFVIDNLADTLDGYTTIRASIQAGENLFSIPNLYERMLEEHWLSYNQLVESYRLAAEQHNNNQVLFDAGAISAITFTQTELELENARFARENFATNFILHLDNRIRDIQNHLTTATNQRQVFHTNTLASISGRILQTETTIQSISQSIDQNQLAQLTTFFEGGELGDISLLRLAEQNNTLNQITSITQEITSLQINLETLQAQIQDATVTAQIDGEIATYMELIQGHFLLSGVQVMSIIPLREETLTVNLLVSNQDIGLLEEGMLIRYNIPAMPRRDFGDITAYVTRISPDITMEGYFLVESVMEDRVYYDTDGNGVRLRVGMAVDARIVVDRQPILFYLLDLVNLWFG